ncbi:putative membrane transporter protein [Candidatus Hydrogenisulfobacillus filiaventi]|uniref:Probable membrane transporter protein n=1 Tax=Candidatus Hydrogenisulfobacillus filiaventi TaxID=2707344 RepID=A0A6F8ZEU6_9FIRM|nr:sulfite exporter TauE/SafE family protein [Bacillota bacterium]CAB1128297.1 putative membrane transporter protein [Candidatus Hydrogenisulfobacillus filiaventi]
MPVIWLLLTGVVTGTLTGFTGASAVVVVVPALTVGLHLPFREAVGTSLAVDVVTSLAVTRSYARAGNLRLRRAWILILGAMAGAQTGVLLAHRLPVRGLVGGFAVFMFGMAANFFWHAWRDIPLVSVRARAAVRPPASPARRLAGVGLIGFLVGNVAGLIGASGGVLFLLALLYGLGFTLREAVGTGTAAMALSALSGALGYARQGEVDAAAWAVVGLVAVVTGFYVAGGVQRIPERFQAAGTGLILLGVGLAMVWHG